jgi:hypothetical protein
MHSSCIVQSSRYSAAFANSLASLAASWHLWGGHCRTSSPGMQDAFPIVFESSFGHCSTRLYRLSGACVLVHSIHFATVKTGQRKQHESCRKKPGSSHSKHTHMTCRNTISGAYATNTSTTSTRSADQGGGYHKLLKHAQPNIPSSAAQYWT